MSQVEGFAEAMTTADILATAVIVVVVNIVWEVARWLLRRKPKP